MNFEHRQYLRESAQRIKRLERIVHGRPVAILAAGPSIREFEDRIDALRNVDICYFGFNRFVQETHILYKINKRYSLYADPCGENLPFTIKKIYEFLGRNDDNMLISGFGRNNDTFNWLGEDFELNQFLSDYDRKLLFFGLCYDRTVPKKKEPLHFISGNTLQIMIQLAIIGKASRIILFGADGGHYKNEKSEGFFYRNSQSKPVPLSNYVNDTSLCFNPLMPLAIRNVYETYDLAPVDILNCSENSFYVPFPNISYDDAFECLTTGKKVTKKTDKRIPKLSVIAVALDTKGFLEETVEKVVEQSYPNFEHIIVCEREDDEIHDLKDRYPRTEWVFEKAGEWHEDLRKGISATRGEYIYYLSPGDYFANPDWLNICMDILENHPDISLVWGLSQEVSDWNGAPGQIRNSEFFQDLPPQGKDFIYYWLKRKYSFRIGSFCVRKSVLEECFPVEDRNVSDENKAWLDFNYKFNTSGYLPFFVPLVATFHKTYFDQGGHRPQGDPIKMHLPYYVPITEKEMVREKVPDEASDRKVNEYHVRIRQYRNSLLIGRANHLFRDGFGQDLEGNFSRFSYFFGDILMRLKRKVPERCSLIVVRGLNAFKQHRWGIFRVGTMKIANRIKS